MHLHLNSGTRILLGLSLLWFAISIPASSQAPSGSAPAAAAQKSMSLDVAVTDKATGKPATGLAQGDFTLLDNGQPVKFSSFQATDSAESAVAFLIFDAVNVSVNEVANERIAVSKYLRLNGGKLSVPISILVFTNKGITDQIPASVDGNDLATKVDQLTGSFPTITDDAGGAGTQERYDVSVNAFMSMVRAAKSITGKKVFVWLGHGWPMLEDLNPQMVLKVEQHVFGSLVEASNQMREEHLTVCTAELGSQDETTFRYQNYVKGVKAAKKTNYSNLTVKVLAVNGGGQVLGPDNNLGAQIDKCLPDTTNFYTLSFDAPHAAGADEYHELKVQVGKPGLTARTSAVFYAQP
jgi:VWFA-related protein